MVKKEVEVSQSSLHNFGLIPNEFMKLLENGTIKHIDYCLLALLWSSSKEYIAIQSVAGERLGVSPRHIRRSYKLLEDLGLIIQRNGIYMTKDYILPVPASCVKNKNKYNIYTKDYNGYVMEFIMFAPKTEEDNKPNVKKIGAIFN